MHFRLNWKKEGGGGENAHNKNQLESVLRQGKERVVLRRKTCSLGRNQLKRTFKLRRMAAPCLLGAGALLWSERATSREGPQPL